MKYVLTCFFFQEKKSYRGIKNSCDNKVFYGSILAGSSSNQIVMGAEMTEIVILNHLYAGQKVFNEWFKNSINHKVSRKELEHCKLNAGP